MRILVALACIAVASARPEAGYNYNPPAPAPVHHHHHAGAATSFGSSGGFGIGGGISTGASATGGFIAQAPAPAPIFAQQPLQQVVQKHIYVHVPPPEPEEVRQQQLLQSGIKQKHYKIIFIKTPSVGPSPAQVALQQQLTEEKTIVYVLVKKPDDVADIQLPELAPSAPSKPEVYFIKYKAQREQGNGGFSQGGGAQIITSADATSSSASGIGGSIGSISGGSASGHAGAIPAQQYGPPGGHHGHNGYH